MEIVLFLHCLFFLSINYSCFLSVCPFDFCTGRISQFLSCFQCPIQLFFMSRIIFLISCNRILFLMDVVYSHIFGDIKVLICVINNAISLAVLLFVEFSVFLLC